MDTVYVEIEYPDGTVARWALPGNDPRIEQAETVLGTPDTLKA